MSDEPMLKEDNCTDLLNSEQCSTQQNSQLSSIEVINEKVQQFGEGDIIPKPEFPVTLPNEIITAQKYESESPNAPQEMAGYGQAQTPYYQQQVVAGQPVYVQGTPGPADASRMAPVRSGPSGRNQYNYSDQDIFYQSFDEVVIRNRFVQKVYTILSVQLAFTFGFIIIAIYTPEVKRFMYRNSLLYILALFLLIATMYALICCISARRVFPLNFILLALLTISYTYLLAFLSTTYSTNIVMGSVGITAIVCICISVFACQTKYDVTTWGLYLCAAAVGLMIFGIIAMIVCMIVQIPALFIAYAIGIGLLFSMFLMYDTQQIMGGRRIELSPEEYIFGALTLYVDIIQIFTVILTLCGNCGNE